MVGTGQISPPTAAAPRRLQLCPADGLSYHRPGLPPWHGVKGTWIPSCWIAVAHPDSAHDHVHNTSIEVVSTSRRTGQNFRRRDPGAAAEGRLNASAMLQSQRPFSLSIDIPKTAATASPALLSTALHPWPILVQPVLFPFLFCSLRPVGSFGRTRLGRQPPACRPGCNVKPRGGLRPLRGDVTCIHHAVAARRCGRRPQSLQQARGSMPKPPR
jgi:hypothetical protein